LVVVRDEADDASGVRAVRGHGWAEGEAVLDVGQAAAEDAARGVRDRVDRAEVDVFFDLRDADIRLRKSAAADERSEA